ncbi:nucleoside 2-deoxyribosyltransferase [Breoghania sp. JC706]|uniref:nucleoside 2-deoxyribosyltransferase n=1 Tax=Breoghania sp. JC706 TaxID=3117732 RepID=UPI00300B733D
MKVFLAGPFKALVDPQEKRMSDHGMAMFVPLIDHFETLGWEVHSAHRREQWGREFMTPDECTRIDYDEIAKCDRFIAYPGFPASPGTHVELGWASALQKDITLLLKRGVEYAFLVRGLQTITRVRTLFYDDAVEPKALEQLLVEA